MKTERSAQEFSDKHGRPVRVGDVLRPVGPNAGRPDGTVVGLVRDRRLKPFVVVLDEGRRQFFNREWCEVRS